MCLAILANLVCCAVIITSFGNTNLDILFPVDWMLVATILIRHCQRMGNNDNSAYRPKTSHMINLSQIVTAK
ncbi:hypothetical protein BDF19DRAFT_437313 [Syncephalis fuscata]|nr:hypothetical protein BDF19DRAFT_437290 [Syncephalis fuscata]KAI9596961.1 hypothetical protein BDF19DRAFT_437313 [Syncephalis fuscata]